MKSEYKTLRELDVQPGDVVEWQDGGDIYTVISAEVLGDESAFAGEVRADLSGYGFGIFGEYCLFRIVSRASRDDSPKLWRDMTPEEKGVLLLAHHEGKAIECWTENSPTWDKTNPQWIDRVAYRVRPEPKVETVAIYGAPSKHVQWCLEQCGLDTHSITFDLIDGKPDVASIKMEELE
jgi:hypothetical protein